MPFKKKEESNKHVGLKVVTAFKDQIPIALTWPMLESNLQQKMHF